MASLEDAKINLTTCSICFETFKTPKHFPCLHSFCEGCINTYIATSFQQKRGGVDCPFCRMFVLKPGDISVQEWAGKLPTNHILVSLIDANEAKSGQKLCAGCSRENETESAVSWCVNCNEALCNMCTRYHGRGKTTYDHKIYELGNDFSVVKHLQHADVLCTEHVEEKIKAYCNDHKAVCCMTCVMLQHRKCDNVISIENAAEQKKQNAEVKEFKKKLEDLRQSLEILVKNRNENIQRFHAEIGNIETDVNCLFKEITEHLSRLKDEMMLKIAEIKNDVKQEIEDKRDEITYQVSILENDIDIYQTIMKHSPPAQFLQTMEKLLEQKKRLEIYEKDQHENARAIQLSFKSNEKLTEIIKDITNFGSVQVRRTVEMLTVVPSLIANVTTKGSGGELALLENGNIVMSNYYNSSIELRDPQCHSVLSSLSLQGKPYGIKMTSDTEGAVAVQRHGLIIFNVQNNQITKIAEVKINLNYDFVFFKCKYYIGCYKKIVVFDSNHRKVGEISVNNNVGYVSLRDDTSLCYTVHGGHVLYCISMDGTPVFTYSHDKLQGTEGITVDHTGYIYVCGYSSKNIHQLSHDGKLQRIIFDNLPAGPYFISFNTQSNEAVVGCYGQMLLYDLK